LEDHLVAAWNAFALDDGGPTVRIVEGAFLQIPVGLMLAMNAAPARIRALCARIDRVVSRLDPTLVYLHRPDLRRAFQALGAERGRQWIDELIAVLRQSAYGRRHRVHDAGGLVAYYRRQRTIVDTLLPGLAMRRLAIDVSGGRWQQYARRISAVLGIRHAAPHELGLAGLLRHVGSYRGAVSKSTSIITTDGQALYLQRPASMSEPLLRVGPGHYCVRSLPIDLRFQYAGDGTARRISYESRMANEARSERLWIRA
jgi:hypothetical protein